MSKLTQILISLFLISVFLSCGNNKAERSNYKRGPRQELVQKREFDNLNRQQNDIVILIPRGGLQNSIKRLVEGGAKLLYDPNNGTSNAIPFYIAELSANHIKDRKFMKSLNVNMASMETTKGMGKINFSNLVQIDQLDITPRGNRRGNEQEIIIAAIDGGVDATHGAFANRVTYWHDSAQSNQTQYMRKLKNTNAKFVVILDENKMINQEREARKFIIFKVPLHRLSGHEDSLL